MIFENCKCNIYTDADYIWKYKNPILKMNLILSYDRSTLP